MLLSVGQLAKLTGFTVRALHHYDAIGLLMPSNRSEAGYRLYSQADVIRLYRIQALQHVGLSLSEIDVALKNDANSLENLIGRQLAQLDEQIERSTLLRAQLQILHGQLKDGKSPDADQWLSTLEMFGTYDRYCSPEEIRALLSHRYDSINEWHALICEARDAMSNGVPAASEQTRLLARRWMRLVMQRMGGDAALAQKMKALYYDNPAIQSRTYSENGFDKAMLDYLLEATNAAHRALWLDNLSPSDVDRLRFDGSWSREWFDLVSAARRQMENDVNAESEPTRELSRRWCTLVLEFADNDRHIEAEVQRVLAVDRDIQEFWNLDQTLSAWMTNLLTSEPQ
jgi:MerR family transcriptional regulator, thiopeptide resistance regulator